jgi:predicted amidohydrolase YtcJ
MKKQRTWLAILAALPISVATTRAQTTKACHDADLVVRDAKIVTMDADHSIATSMAVRDGRVLRVGTTKDVAQCISSYTTILDLHGKTVLPGLIDTHTHLTDWALRSFRNSIDASDPAFHSIEDITKAVAQVVASKPKGTWIRGAGWDPAKLTEHRNINRHDLDSISPDNPVFLRQFSGHMAVINTAGLRLAGITRDTPDPRGGQIERDEAGQPTGLLKDNAVDLIEPLLPPVAPEDIVRSVAKISEAAASSGITTIHEITEHLPAYQTAHRKGLLKVRVLVSPIVNTMADAEVLAKSGVSTGFGDDYLKLGAAKIFADGSFSANTAAIYTPAEDTPGNLGLLIWKPEELQKVHHILASAGWQLETHANGDRAIDVVLDSYQAVTKELGLVEPRFRVEHCTISTPAILKRLRELHVVVSSNPPFVSQSGNHFGRYGAERARWMFPEKSYFANGIVAGAGSDSPIAPLNPWFGISAAVLRRANQTGQVISLEERVSVLQALDMYTRNAAYLGFEEDKKGSLEPGKLADFILVDRDVLSVSPEELKDVKTLKTFVGGELVFESRP